MSINKLMNLETYELESIRKFESLVVACGITDGWGSCGSNAQ
ncbi:hypothetical protein [Clostridium faecium]|nr:hypothetical protein [Clostridium faecium]MDU1349470.1 hypothetical protein [Clostridium argentinense]